MRVQSLACLTSAAALLMAMSTAPALADSVSNTTSQTQTNQVTNNGGTGNGADQTSQINGSAGAGASGNIGFNSAAGNANQQANTLVLETNGTASGGGGLNGSNYSTQTLSNVSNGGNSNTAGWVNNNNSSVLGDTTASSSVPAGNQSPQGNFGANSAAGDFNQQDNLTIVSKKPPAVASDNGKTSGPAQPIQQNIYGPSSFNPNQTGTDMRGTAYNAQITGKMGQNVNGNAGFNSAAGEKNQQSNALLLYSNSTSGPTGANAPEATENTTQYIGADPRNFPTYGDFVHQSGSGTLYNASVDGNALNGATGNLGANVAAGADNQQVNSTILTPTFPATANSSVTQTSSQTIGGSSLYNNTSESGGGGYPQFKSLIAPSQNLNGGGSGNVGVNSAAGGMNEQENSLFVGDPPAVTQTVNQTLSPGIQASFTPADGTISTISGSTGYAFAGRYGANSTVGAQNIQSNKAALISGGAASTTQNFNQSVTGPVTAVLTTGTGSNALNTSNGTFGSGGEQSIIGQYAGADASGIVGFNSAAGVQNLQANGVVIVSGTSASPTNTQGYPGSGGTPTQISNGYFILSGNNLSAITDNAGGSYSGGASGNLGFNSAAGAQNVQNNGLVLYGDNNAGTQSTPTSIQNYNQVTTVYSAAQCCPSTIHDASDLSYINGNAAKNASGVIGFNSASGAQNQQSNAASIFSPTPLSSTSASGGVTGSPNVTMNWSQKVTGAATAVPLDRDTFTSDIGGNAGAGVSGVTGFNSAAGAGNQQMGLVTVMSNNNAGAVGAFSPTIGPSSPPAQSNSALNVTSSGGTWTANIDGTAFTGGKGVISANTTSGGYNQQANVVLLTTGNLANVSPSQQQQSTGSTIVSGTTTANANIGGSAFSGASGVIGANASAGVGNMQANTVIVQH